MTSFDQVINNVTQSISNPEISPTTVLERLHWTGVVGALLLIVLGLLFLFFGYRLFKFTLFMGGFIVLGYITYNILYKANISGMVDLGSNSTTILAVATGIAGLIGGILAVMVWKVGLVLVGVAGGYFFAMVILCLQDGSLIQDETYRFVFIILCSVITGAAVLYFERHILIIATSLGGSISTHVGLSSFLGFSFSRAFQVIIVQPIPTSVSFTLGSEGVPILISILVVTLIGIVVQYKVTSKTRANVYEQNNDD